jgi:hypothetical protein
MSGATETTTLASEFRWTLPQTCKVRALLRSTEESDLWRAGTEKRFAMGHRSRTFALATRHETQKSVDSGLEHRFAGCDAYLAECKPTPNLPTGLVVVLATQNAAPQAPARGNGSQASGSTELLTSDPVRDSRLACFAHSSSTGTVSLGGGAPLDGDDYG